MKASPILGPARRQAGAASTWVLLGFAAVALFFLLAEHRAHLYGWLPYLLFAACPLMHLFHGHGGHGRHDSGQKGAGPDRSDASKRTVAGPGAPDLHQHH